jgi:hypothetical protein
MESKAGSRFLFYRASLPENRFTLFRTHSSCVIPEGCEAPYPGSQRAPAIVTIPDNACGVSGMTLSGRIADYVYLPHRRPQLGSGRKSFQHTPHGLSLKVE